MKPLHLNLKRKWFDMIKSGEKKEEYRDLSPYWKTRFKNAKSNGISEIIFSNGYAKNRDQIKVKLKYISIRSGLPVWGAEKDKIYFVLHLGKVEVIK